MVVMVAARRRGRFKVLRVVGGRCRDVGGVLESVFTAAAKLLCSKDRDGSFGLLGSLGGRLAGGKEGCSESSITFSAFHKETRKILLY